MSQWSHEHPELVGHPDHDPWMQHESYRKVAPVSEVERDQLRDERAALTRLVTHPSVLHLDIPVCWQCGHPEEAHTVEDRGCTDPDCSCAQVPQA